MGFLRIHIIKDPETRKGYTFIGDSSRIEGSIKVKGELVINGSVEGTIKCDTLISSADSKIKGRVEARTATLSGIVESEVNVQEHLVITETGKLKGRISYGTLSLEPGGIISGECFQVKPESKKVIALDQLDSFSASY